MAREKAVLNSRKRRATGRGPSAPDGQEGASLFKQLSFPVVAIGASAGGLAAFTALLKALPPKTGMAFVLIQHLEPKHESALTTLLSRVTEMSVVEVSDGLAVEPNHVFVIPPNKRMTIRKGTLRLMPRSEGPALQRPIDEFSMALAEEQGSAAIAVVLSGTGSDGTDGLKAIRAAGGVTFAQDPKTAQWAAMPMSAIGAGSADFVFSPKRIATELARIGRHPGLAEATAVPDGSELDQFCVALQPLVGIDFRMYKRPTVRRRIARRMALQKIPSLSKYAQILKRNPGEAKALAEDIFIHVTGFFRDPECFQALRKSVLAKLRVKRSGADSIRIWVAGSSTGEEVYSIAMLLLEELGEQSGRTKIQIFGTDIQKQAVEHARAGLYTETAIAGVSPARLKRFFVKTDHGYQIQQFIRELCVFAAHDLAKDPPFSRLDLISCRNVLIYLGAALQKRTLSMFQYALKSGGFLFLGHSESINDYSDVFAAEDRKHRIFLRKPGAGIHKFDVTLDRLREADSAAQKITGASVAVDLAKEAEGILLEHYAPAAIVVDSDLHIVYVQGDTSPYLAAASGQPSFHLLKMVRPELVVDLRAAISKARREGLTISKEAVEFDNQGQPAAVRLEVRPLKKRNAKKQDVLVVFQKVEPVSLRPIVDGGRKAAAGQRNTPRKMGRLEEEASMRERMRGLIEEHESAQEEMKASNEEVLSANEELQSTNEELETAREELQSSNEELVTLNDELQHRNSELNVLTQDLTNLLAGVDIPVLVLDAKLRIRRFTPIAGTLLNLIPGDVGRPFSHIASNLEVADWKEMFAEVIGQGKFTVRDVSSREGNRYSMRMRPYKTSDNKIEGVLVVLLDTELVSRARDKAQESASLARAQLEMSESTVRALVEASPQSVIGVSADRRIALVNGTTERMFGYPSAELIGQPFETVIPEDARDGHDEDHRELGKIQSLPTGTSLDLAGRRKDGTLFPVEIRANVIETSAGKLCVAYVSDISQRKQMEQAAQAHIRQIRESEERFRNMADTAPVMLWVSGPDKLCTFFNKGWLEFTGRSLADELGNGWADSVHSEDLDRCQNIYSSSFDARRTFQIEYRLRRADGEYRWVLDSGTPRFDDRAGFMGYIGSGVDITDLKSAHKEHLAKQKLETVGTLAAGIAHDFNNLLGAVIAQSELALSELASGVTPEEELQRIQDAAMRGAEIVRQLMVYAGEESEVLELLDLSEMVKDMLELLKVSVSKRVTVEADLSNRLPAVRANPAQIRQIMMNLFHNASEAITDRDGVIRVGTSRVTVGPNSSPATTMPAGDYVQLEISDTGRGMTPEVQARVFDPFFTTKLTGSHGHGLVVVKQIAERHHGAIRLSSAPGKGTTFQIMLPCEELAVTATRSTTEHGEEETTAARRGTILVVEDEELLRQAVSAMLRKKGLSVLEASDGSAALEVIRAQKDEIDLLLLDITLPGANSREVYEEARRQRPELPVIITSAKSEAMAAASLGTGVERFLRKPFSLDDLIALIRQSYFPERAPS